MLLLPKLDDKGQKKFPSTLSTSIVYTVTMNIQSVHKLF